MGKEEIAEDYCFVCKDGGQLMICDYGDCIKAYHPACVGKDDSFMTSGTNWSCDWHSCHGPHGCKKKPKVQCFCCPKSYCSQCIKDVFFVQVKKKDKGFCNHCLKLAKLIEEGVDEDSDGEKVDFKDTETYEYLFYDYWVIVKDREALSLEDLRVAHHALKGGDNYSYQSASEQCYEDNKEYMPFETFEGNRFNDDPQHDETRRTGVTTSFRKQRQKRKNFHGWGSEELISFLKSTGKDTDVPISQMEATEIINRYAQTKNLYHPDKKKKKILCDEKLFSLFRRKAVKPVKIYSLLDNHFPCNRSDDEFDFGSEEEDALISKNILKTNFDRETKSCQSSKKLRDLTICLAPLIRENVKLVYLRRSLVLNLLANPEVLESKLVGSFVRVKLDPKDYSYSPGKIYRLGLVTAIKRTGELYKTAEVTTDVVLSVTNVWKDVPISMLSEDDFEEVECEELHQLASSGPFGRPTVVQLQHKADLLHQDITSHWINKELARLQKQIDLANEKGWRREHLEHIERRDHLLKKEEQERLLKEKPEVIPEIEQDLKDKCPQLKIERRKEEETIKAAEEHPVTDKISLAVENHDEYEDGDKLRKNHVQIPVINLDEEDDDGNSNHNLTPASIDATVDPVVSEGSNLVQGAINIKIIGEQNGNHSALDRPDIAAVSITDPKSNDHPSALNERTGFAGKNTNADVPQDVAEMINAVWYYVDPYGNVQGPFKLDSLRQWWDQGFFSNDFKVWRHDQTQTEAVILYDVLNLVRKYQHTT